MNLQLFGRFNRHFYHRKHHKQFQNLLCGREGLFSKSAFAGLPEMTQ